MNKAAARRLIPKQEALVLLGGLDLTACTESLITVSVNNSRALRKAEEKSTDKSFITAYAKRPSQFETMSLYDYYLHTRNTPEARKKRAGNKYIIPNFCGLNGTPRFPVTDSYARHTLIVYRPWRKYPTAMNWKQEFDLFINSKFCPKSARMAYDRVMTRYYDKMTHYEPKSSNIDHSRNAITDPDDAELLDIMGLQGGKTNDKMLSIIESLHRGKNYKWDKKPSVSFIWLKLLSLFLSCYKPQKCSWLKLNLKFLT